MLDRSNQLFSTIFQICRQCKSFRWLSYSNQGISFETEAFEGKQISKIWPKTLTSTKFVPKETVQYIGIGLLGNKAFILLAISYPGGNSKN